MNQKLFAQIISDKILAINEINPVKVDKTRKAWFFTFVYFLSDIGKKETRH